MLTFLPGVIPIALWALLKWFGSESANLMECWALYGYANIIWIPVALISWSPVTSQYSFHFLLPPLIVVQFLIGSSWASALASRLCFSSATCEVDMSLSPAMSLTLPRYPVLSATDVKTSKILLIVVVVLHAGLAIAIQILFFAYVPTSILCLR